MYLNKQADIFVISQEKVLALLGEKEIEIEGKDTNVVVKLLRLIRDIHPSVEQILDCYSRKDEIKGVIDYIKEIGLILDKDLSITGQEKLITPYAPFSLMGHVWYCRRGRKILFFLADNYEDACDKLKRIALNWVQEKEYGILIPLIERKIECITAAINFPDHLDVSGLTDENVLVYDSEDNKKFFYNNYCKMIRVGTWTDIIGRMDNDLGIVAAMEEIKGDTPFLLSGFTYQSRHRLISLNDSDDWQIGRSEFAEEAKVKAIMEAIERYCGKYRIADNRTLASYKDIGSDGLNPLSMSCFLEEQFSNGWLKDLARFGAYYESNWEKTVNYLTGDEKKVLECFVSYGNHIYCDDVIFKTNSNGMAAHTNINRAVRNAALELIERDSILIYWINRISPKKIVLEEDLALNMRDKLDSIGYDLYILNLSLDTVPVVMAVAKSRNSETPWFFCGAAASERLFDAISKSIKELEFTVWSGIKNARFTQEKMENLDACSVFNPMDHQALYLKKEMAHHLDFLLGGEEIYIRKEKLVEEKDLFVGLYKLGFNIYYVDMTIPEVEQLNLRIKVVRVLIPGLVPMTFGYGREPLGMKRIYEVPKELKLRDNVISTEEVIANYLPHFFS